jgi:SAM-dependent methyltransferase
LKNQELEEIFTEIYDKNAWGGEPGKFYSGTGTHNSNTAIYVENVVRFIKERNIKSVLDIGCGDFTVMQQVTASAADVHYLGVDLVSSLIENHRQKFQNDHVHFSVLNAVKDPLPQADLITVRQVLQHLSNAHIQVILQKLAQYKYVLITEHVPIGPDITPNLDKIAGSHIRIRVNSGVFIDKPPFSLPNVKVLFEYRHDDPVKGKLVPAVIRTYLVENTTTS